MKPHAYTYESPQKQTVHFRGYTKDYSKSPKIIIHTCSEVRKSKFEALKDAEELIKKLKLSHADTH